MPPGARGRLQAPDGAGEQEGALTVVLLAVLLHVNLVVAFGWFAVGVAVCRGEAEGLTVRVCSAAPRTRSCPTMRKGLWGFPKTVSQPRDSAKALSLTAAPQLTRTEEAPAEVPMGRPP